MSKTSTPMKTLNPPVSHALRGTAGTYSVSVLHSFTVFQTPNTLWPSKPGPGPAAFWGLEKVWKTWTVPDVFAVHSVILCYECRLLFSWDVVCVNMFYVILGVTYTGRAVQQGGGVFHISTPAHSCLAVQFIYFKIKQWGALTAEFHTADTACSKSLWGALQLCRLSQSVPCYITCTFMYSFVYLSRQYLLCFSCIYVYVQWHTPGK